MASNPQSANSGAPLSQAVTDLLSQIDASAGGSHRTKKQLRRLAAYQEVLDRLFTAPSTAPVELGRGVDGSWVLAGSISVLARFDSERQGARFSNDIDLTTRLEGRSGSQLVSQLLKDLETNIRNPLFSFAVATDPTTGTEAITKVVHSQDGVEQEVGARVMVTAFLGGVKLSDRPFALDLTYAPLDSVVEYVPAPVLSPAVGERPVSYPVIPLESVVAGKVASVLFAPPGERPLPNSKDWYDLAFIAERGSLNAELLRSEIEQLATSQGVELSRLPHLLAGVDQDATSERWGKQLEAFRLKSEKSFAEAYQQASGILEPVLDGSATGFYEPTSGTWGHQSQAVSPMSPTWIAESLGAGISR